MIFSPAEISEVGTKTPLTLILKAYVFWNGLQKTQQLNFRKKNFYKFFENWRRAAQSGATPSKTYLDHATNLTVLIVYRDVVLEKLKQQNNNM